MLSGAPGPVIKRLLVAGIGNNAMVDMPEEPKLPVVGLMTWLGLIWNGSGAFVVILVTWFPTTGTQPLPPLPSWVQVLIGLFPLWVIILPFTTLAVTISLWESRRAIVSRMLLLYSFVVLLLWGSFLAIFCIVMADRG